MTKIPTDERKVATATLNKRVSILERNMSRVLAELKLPRKKSIPDLTPKTPAPGLAGLRIKPKTRRTGLDLEDSDDD